MDVLRRYVLGEDPALLLMNALAELRPKDVQDVADAMWTLDLELNSSEPPAPPATIVRLMDMIKGYVEASPRERYDTICATVELETLGQCGLVDLESMRKSLKKKNTFLKFRQTKFNLVREESEGYAKLLTELLGENPLEVMVKNSLALIGYFRLDPNRVMDLILDSLHHSPDRLCRICQEMFVEPSQSVGKLEDLISFKLSRMSKVTNANARKATLKSIAYLLAHGIYSVQSIVPHLKVESLVTACAKQDEEVSPSKQKDEQTVAVLMREVDPIESQLLTDLIALTLDAENGWKCTLELLDSIRGLERHVFRDADACKALHAFIEREIALVYSEVYVQEGKPLSSEARGALLSKSQIKIQTIGDFCAKLCPFLIRIGPESVSASVTNSAVLLHRVVRLLPRLQDQDLVEQLLILCVFPAVTLLPSSNPVIVQELWDGVMSKMESTKRFALYERWRDVIEKRPIRPELTACGKVHLEQVNFALKRFCSDIERNLVPSRKFAKVAHVNPFCAFQNALRISDNLIPFMVQSLEYCTKLDLDVLGFLFCDVLVQTKADKMKSDLTNDALWFSATCQLIGEAFSKCPDMDISPLLELVFDRCVSKSDLMFLRVLEVLLTRTTMMDIVTDYSKSLLESSGGSDTLRLVAFCAFSIAPQRRAKFASFAMGQRQMSLERFRKLLEDESHGPFFIKFLLAAAFQRKKMLFETKLAFPGEPQKSLKLKSLLYDQVSAIFFQLSNFVTSEGSAVKLEKNVPTLKDMIKQFQIEPALALHLRRMVLAPKRKANEIGRFDKEEFQSLLFPETNNAETLIDLFARFWELSLYDVNLPRTQYEAERNQLESMKRELEKESGTTVVKRMVNKTRELSVTLKNDLAQQTTRVDTVKKVLAAEKQGWREALSSDEAMQTFFQKCLVPRVLLSPEDAFYSAKFIQQALLVSGAKELADFERRFLSVVFSSMASLIQTSTERETEHLGIFLTETLEWIEAFVSDISVNGVPIASEYAHISQWKNDLTDRMVFALDAKENNSSLAFQALTLLSALKEVFPDTDAIAKRLHPVLARFAKDEDNEAENGEGDGFNEAQKAMLKGKANSLLGAIKKRRDARKLRDANGKFPPAPPPEAQQQPKMVPASVAMSLEYNIPSRNGPPPSSSSVSSAAPSSLLGAKAKPGGGPIASLLGKPAPPQLTPTPATTASTMVKPIPSLTGRTGVNSQQQAQQPSQAKPPVTSLQSATNATKPGPNVAPAGTKPANQPPATAAPKPTSLQSVQSSVKATSTPPPPQQPQQQTQGIAAGAAAQKKPLQPVVSAKMPTLIPVPSTSAQQKPSSDSSVTPASSAKAPQQQQQQPPSVNKVAPPQQQSSNSQPQPAKPPQQQPAKSQQEQQQQASKAGGGGKQQDTQQKTQQPSVQKESTGERGQRQPSKGRGRRGAGDSDDRQQQPRQQQRDNDDRDILRRSDSRAGSDEAATSSRDRGMKRAATESGTELESRTRRGDAPRQAQQRPSSGMRSPPRREEKRNEGRRDDDQQQQSSGRGRSRQRPRSTDRGDRDRGERNERERGDRGDRGGGGEAARGSSGNDNRNDRGQPRREQQDRGGGRNRSAKRGRDDSEGPAASKRTRTGRY